jgi:hypothetical protein
MAVAFAIWARLVLIRPTVDLRFAVRVQSNARVRVVAPDTLVVLQTLVARRLITTDVTPFHCRELSLQLSNLRIYLLQRLLILKQLLSEQAVTNRLHKPNR